MKPIYTLFLAALLMGCNTSFKEHETREFAHYTEVYGHYLQVKYEMTEDDAYTVSAYLRGADTVISAPIIDYKAVIDSEIRDNQ